LSEHFSEERLLNLLGQSLDQPFEALLERVADHVLLWSSGTDMSNDISALLIERV
jgi:hypothetical protein